MFTHQISVIQKVLVLELDVWSLCTPPALLCFSPLRLLEVATIRATSYLRSVCSHRSTLLGAESSSCPKMCCGGFLHDHGGALLGKTARECAVVVVNAVTRAHYLAGSIVPATKCAAMTTILTHEPGWPRHMCKDASAAALSQP